MHQTCLQNLTNEIGQGITRKMVVYSVIIHGAGTKLALPLMQERVRARFPSQ